MADDLKTAIVTGAYGGIGKSIVQRLTQEGYRVCHLIRDLGNASNIVQDDSSLVVECDLSLIDDRKQAWSKIREWTKQIDLLVNAAGVAFGAPAMMTSDSDLKRVFEVNYVAAVDLSQRVGRVMMRQQCGSIINILSVQALLAEPGNLAYGGSKAALAHATRVMASEWGKFGIRVNAVAPTVVSTKMMCLMEETARDRLVSASALGSILDPNDVAELVFFLASSKADQINGQIIRIDGGMSY